MDRRPEILSQANLAEPGAEGEPRVSDFHLLNPAHFRLPGVPDFPISTECDPQGARRMFLPQRTTAQEKRQVDLNVARLAHTSPFVKASTLSTDSGQASGAATVGPSTFAHLTEKKRLIPIQLTEAEHQKVHAFSEIVDEDLQEAFDNYVSEELCGRLVECAPFRLFILFVIIVNSFLIGAQTVDYVEQQWAGVLSTADSVFMTIFVVEILLKWYNGFFSFWKVGWNVFDFVIVASSLLGQSISFISSGRVLRILRVLRAFRTLRSISVLESLQVIVQTILRSLPDMGNIIMLLMIIMFIFGVIGVTVFAKDLPEHFNDLPNALFTLFVALTEDGWMDIMKLMKLRGLWTGGAIYFILFILVGSFIMSNLVVGVTVNNLQDEYKRIRARERAKSRYLIATRNDNLPPRRVVSISSVPPSIWREQEPHELPEFNNMTLTILEKYFLIQSAIEQNLREFETCKKDLSEILGDVAQFNEEQLLETEASEDKEVAQAREEEEDEEILMAGGEDGEVAQGDFLSLLMRQDNQKRKIHFESEARREKAVMRNRARVLEIGVEQDSRAERAMLWAEGRIDEADELGV